MSEEAWEHVSIPTNGVRLHVVMAGPEDGEPVLLLHGFPEFWRAWRAQIGPLTEAGFRVLVPDQRGYNTSDKPRAVADYRLHILGRDTVGLLDALGYEKAVVIGHDWGGGLAWWLAMNHADRFRAGVSLNCPHPVALRREMLVNPRQLLRSWYMFLFQLPVLPERFLGANDWKRTWGSMVGSSRRGTFSREDFVHYRKAWSQPGSFTAMLHWYRAAFQQPSKLPESIRIRIPFLLLWGARDHALGRELIAPSVALCDDGRAEICERASHWIQHEEPAWVSRALLSFLDSLA